MKYLFVIAGMVSVLFLAGPNKVEAQKKTPDKASASAKVVTAKGYRDLIVNNVDGMSGFTSFGEISPGTRVGYDDKGRQRDCIMTFTVTAAKEKFVADQIKAWTRVRVPRALAASHAEILKWMKSSGAKAKLVPQCFEPILNAGAAQWDFMVAAGGYDDIRVNAAKALKRLGVDLPPMEKSTPEKK